MVVSGVFFGHINCMYPEAQLKGYGILENSRIIQNLTSIESLDKGNFFLYSGPNNITIRNNTFRIYLPKGKYAALLWVSYGRRDCVPNDGELQTVRFLENELS